MSFKTHVTLATLACALACSSGPAGESAFTSAGSGGSDPGSGGGSGSGSGPGGVGGGIGVPDAGGSAPLNVRIQRQGLVVDIVTIACGETCAEVEAVVMGGYKPYSFTWEDGSTNPVRRICPSALTEYEVSVTDAGAGSGEFPRPPQTVKARVSSEVLECPPDAGPPDTGVPPTGLCVDNPSFEGTPGLTEFTGFTAPPWVICDPPGSPDIRNDAIGWSAPGQLPTHGATYLEILWLGAAWRETLSAPLCAPLVSGREYSFKIDLSWQGWVEGASAGRLEIWASSASCGEEQLLWTSPRLPQTWQNYCVTFTAQQAFTHLQLKPTEQRTGVLADNIVPVARCTP
jgi:hypothetical protein